MADLSLIRESFGSFEVRGASGVVLIGAGVMVGGAIVHFGKKAYDSYKNSAAKTELEKWLRTQLESPNLSTDMRQTYSEMLANLMVC